MSTQKFATNALHAGHDVTKNGGTRAVPIYQTTSYVFNNAEHAANLFLIIHPASTTHQQLNEEQQAATGVTEDLIRLSVGLEDIEDLKADLKSVFENIKNPQLV